MEFKILNDLNQLTQIDQELGSKLQVLFKHSTRCSVSLFANKNLQREMSEINSELVDVYYLDLLNYRSISNEIAVRYNVVHESPQILLIKNGKCVYYAAHDNVSLLDAIRNIQLK